MASVLRTGSRAKPKTKDVLMEVPPSFDELNLPKNLVQGMMLAGYHQPSPVQAKAIPVVRAGFDTVIQAKSGTGKTLVFSTLAAEWIDIAIQDPQVVIIAHTREIAQQIKGVVAAVSQASPGIRVEAFIGGLHIDDDRVRAKRCHIVVATPGRLKDLIKRHFLSMENVGLLVIDEADKTLEESFLPDIKAIVEPLLEYVQLVATSATFSDPILEILKNWMREDMKEVFLDFERPTLFGVKQYSHRIEGAKAVDVWKNKENAILKILGGTPFNQCIIFCNQRNKGENLATMLDDQGYASAYISGTQRQATRSQHVEDMRSFELRVLISTDLTSRGLDIERINLVINTDIPPDGETYLHRVGRTGRFGTHGAAVTLVAQSDLDTFNKFTSKYDIDIEDLPADLRIPAHILDSLVCSKKDQEALDLHRRVRTEAVEDIRQAREELIPDTFEIEDHTNTQGQYAAAVATPWASISHEEAEKVFAPAADIRFQNPLADSNQGTIEVEEDFPDGDDLLLEEPQETPPSLPSISTPQGQREARASLKRSAISPSEPLSHQRPAEYPGMYSPCLSSQAELHHGHSPVYPPVYHYPYHPHSYCPPSPYAAPHLSHIPPPQKRPRPQNL